MKSATNSQTNFRKDHTMTETTTAAEAPATDSPPADAPFTAVADMQAPPAMKPAERAPEVFSSLAQQRIFESGKRIEKMQRKLGQLQAKWSEATALRDKAAEARNAQAKEIEDAQGDLLKLATGGHAETLPFPDPPDDDAPAVAQNKAAASAGDWEKTWRGQLIDVLNPGLTPAKLRILHEHTPPIRTMGDMAAWQQAKGDWWFKDIKGFGQGGADAYATAADVYWKEHPEPTAPAASKPVDAPVPAVPAAEPTKAADVEIVLKLRDETLTWGVLIQLEPADFGEINSIYHVALSRGKEMKAGKLGHKTRVDAIVSAIASVRDWLRLQKSLTKKLALTADETARHEKITEALDKLADDTAAAQASADVAAMAKDGAVQRAAAV